MFSKKMGLLKRKKRNTIKIGEERKIKEKGWAKTPLSKTKKKKKVGGRVGDRRCRRKKFCLSLFLVFFLLAPRGSLFFLFNYLFLSNM